MAVVTHESSKNGVLRKDGGVPSATESYESQALLLLLLPQITSRADRTELLINKQRLMTF